MKWQWQEINDPGFTAVLDDDAVVGAVEVWLIAFLEKQNEYLIFDTQYVMKKNKWN